MEQTPGNTADGHSKGTVGKNISLLIVAGYRVGTRTSVTGASTAWYQQKGLLSQDKGEEDPIDAFITNMEEWL